MQKNITKLLAFVWLVFFPFLVEYFLKDNDYDLTEEEIKFIKAYRLIWWYIFWGLVLIVSLYILLLIFKLNQFFVIVNILLAVLFLFLIVNIFFIFSWKLPFGKTDVLNNFKGIKIENTWFDLNKFFCYIPFFNFYLLLTWNNQYEKYLKESNIFWFVLIVVWVFSIFWNIDWWFYFLLFILILRIVSISIWIDLNFAKINFFSKFPHETLVYLESAIYWLLNDFILFITWKKTLWYFIYLHKIKKFYLTWYPIKSLKKTKKYLFLILSYVIFILTSVYLTRYAIVWSNYIALFSVLGLTYYILFPVYFEKNVYPIPFLSLFLFYILKNF